MEQVDVEKLRLELIQASIDFMNTISDISLVAFMDVERKRIKMICDADYETLRGLKLMLDHKIDI